MEAPATTPQADGDPDETESGPAREMSLHLLRMLETRMDAAGIALQSEIQSLLIAAAAAAACGAPRSSSPSGAASCCWPSCLPPNLRVPVLAGAVVAAFVIGGVWRAGSLRNRKVDRHAKWVR